MSTSGRNGSGSERSGPPNPAEQWSNALGGFIRAQRQMAKLSLREMAAMTSVSNAYLSQVERGLHQPSLKVLRSIADALQLSTDQMLSQAGWSSPDREDGVDTTPEERVARGPGGTEEAIRGDERLSDEQKKALIGVYRSFVDRASTGA
ncbi:MAG: helix-turn-helix domain-containing protein [Actinomycetota bacterium]|nr:helix-turn-helix domain-containing protein [Actinomycetota bacterium]